MTFFACEFCGYKGFQPHVCNFGYQFPVEKMVDKEIFLFLAGQIISARFLGWGSSVHHGAVAIVEMEDGFIQSLPLEKVKFRLTQTEMNYYQRESQSNKNRGE